MLVGFDAQATQGRRSGLGVYASNLLAAIREEIREPLQLRVYTEALLPVQNVSTLRRLRWENLTLPILAKRDRVDLLHVPAFAPAFFKPCRLVVTVHDIAGMLFKNQMGKASSFYWGAWLPFVVKNADRVIADSQYTKQDLMRHLRIPERKITVIYPSGHEAFTSAISPSAIEAAKKNLGIRGHYFLFVGTLEPRKNLKRILEAFRVFSDKHGDYQLVIAGSKEFGYGQYMAALAQAHNLASDSVRATGFIDHDTLNALYCGARALIFPSLYEGFGIPILEAMASGCPVLTAKATSTPEVAGDAAILVDPYNVSAIAEGMERLAGGGSLREDLRCRGFKQKNYFSWKKAAHETIKIYQSLF